MTDHWIVTASGIKFDLIDPQPYMVIVSDIVSGLSKTCRFTGQVSRYFSVAEHSTNAAYLLPAPLRMAGLLHDAAEAYYGDMSTPLKAALPEYRVMEKRCQAVIYDKWLGGQLKPDDCMLLKMVDLQLLRAEARELVTGRGADWPCINNVMDVSVPIVGLDPVAAAARWLSEWRLAGGTS